jgi:cell division protein YceG involved in septum cleavage
MRFVLRLFAIAALIAVLGGVWLFYRLDQPYRGFSAPVFVEFAHGTSTRDMAATLKKKGVIADDWLFLAARALRWN